MHAGKPNRAPADEAALPASWTGACLRPWPMVVLQWPISTTIDPNSAVPAEAAGFPRRKHTPKNQWNNHWAMPALGLCGLLSLKLCRKEPRLRLPPSGSPRVRDHRSQGLRGLFSTIDGWASVRDGPPLEAFARRTDGSWRRALACRAPPAVNDNRHWQNNIREVSKCVAAAGRAKIHSTGILRYRFGLPSLPVSCATGDPAVAVRHTFLKFKRLRRKRNDSGANIAMNRSMAITKITGHGLATIAVLVAILWGCLFLERTIVRRARIQHYRALRDIRTMQLRKGVQPVSTPAQPSNPGYSTGSKGPAIG